MKKLVLLSAIISSVTYADVPNSFTSGTKALASEVNENFTYLDDKIDTLTTAVDSNSAAISNNDGSSSVALECDNSDWFDYTNPVTYSSKTGNVGSVINVGNNEYTLVKIPFSDHQGKLYSITFPSVNSNGAPSPQLSINIVNGSTHCSSFDISGYPARWDDVNIGQTIRLFGASPYLETSYSFYTRIKVGNSVVAVGFVERISSELNISATDYDYSNQLTLNDFTINSVVKSNFDDLIDYIQIEEVN